MKINDIFEKHIEIIYVNLYNLVVLWIFSMMKGVLYEGIIKERIQRMHA